MRPEGYLDTAVAARWTVTAGAFACAVLLAPLGAEAQRVRSGTLRIESNPPGATVLRVADEPQNLGVTPVRRVRVPRGEQALVFRLAGYRDHQTTVTVTGRRQRVEITLAPVIRLAFQAGNDAGHGASITLDGNELGATPLETTVDPGRHLVQAVREGYARHRQWLEVSEGESLTVPILLYTPPPNAGSLVVAADTPVEVSIGGEAYGPAPVSVRLPEGPVQVTLLAPDGRSRERRVEVVANEEQTLFAQFSEPTNELGRVHVACSTDGATILIDGEVIDASQANTSLPAGQHLLEVRAPGHTPDFQVFQIEPNRSTALVVELAALETGTIEIDVNAQGSEIWIDDVLVPGDSHVARGVPAGDRRVRISAPGYDPVEETCQVIAGNVCRIQSVLTPSGRRVTIEADVDHAQLRVDGHDVGPLPFEGYLSRDGHVLLVSVDGFAEQSREILVGDDEASMSFEFLRSEDRSSSESQLSVLSARPLREGELALAVSGGFPTILELEFVSGTPWPADARVNLRTSGRLTSIELATAAGVSPEPWLALGARVGAGGGFGPEADSWFFNFDLIGSTHFGPFVVSARARFEVFSDRYNFTERDASVPLSNAARQAGARLAAGAAVEWFPLPRLALGVQGDVTLLDRAEGRRILGNLLGAAGGDPLFSFQASTTIRLD